MVLLNGLFYGVAEGVGSFGVGLVYSIKPSICAVRTVYRFAGGADGEQPTGLIYSSGKFYGVTRSGAADYGTVFKLTL